MSRGFYQRQSRDAAVTMLIARPMMNIFFPELSHFEQPLSGEVCARRQIWEKLLGIPGSPDGWGRDIWFLIETAMIGYHSKEVFLGSKNHTSYEDYKDDVLKLSKMAEQVEITIIREAIKYGRLHLHLKNMIEAKFYACKNCGTSFRAMSPDDIHIVAIIDPCKKQDSVGIPNDCNECHERSVLHWDIKHERFEDDFDRINMASD